MKRKRILIACVTIGVLCLSCLSWFEMWQWMWDIGDRGELESWGLEG